MVNEMKKISSFICGHYVYILLFFCIPVEIKAEATVSLVTNEWVPYMTVADNGIFTKDEIKNRKCSDGHGILSCIVAAAFSLEGITVEFKFYPQGRAFNMAERGIENGAVGWNRNAEREEVFYYSDPLMKKDRVYFHLKSYSFDWKTIDDLKGLRIGGDISTNYSEEFMNAEKTGKIKVDRVAHKKFNFHKLAAGRINVYPMIKDAGYDYIKKYLSPEKAQLITHHPKVMHEATWHLIFNKKREENIRLIKIFNRGLQKLKESGKYDQYFKGGKLKE